VLVARTLQIAGLRQVCELAQAFENLGELPAVN